MDVGQFPTISGNMQTRCHSQSHYGCQAGPLDTWAVSTQMSTHPHQQLSGLGRQELAPLVPKLRPGLALERLPQPSKHWNLSLIGDSNSPPQDRIRQPFIFILDAEERGFAADPVDRESGAERVLLVSLQTTKSTTVSELVAAVSHECQRRGIHTGLELNGARYTVGSCLTDSIWRQNVNPANLRTYLLSESQSHSRNEQSLYAADCLGWIKEEPRPTIFVFLPPSDPLMNHPDPGRRAKPGLPRVGRSAVAATDISSCFALGTLVLLEDGSHAEVQNLAGSMVRTTDGYSARVSRVHQFHISDAANIANCLWNVLSSSHYVRLPGVPSPITESSTMPRAGDWVRVDGTSWWRDGRLLDLPTPQIAIPYGLPLPSQGNALFNIQFDSQHSHLGVVLGGSKMLLEEGETAPGVLGLQATTMGNGVCRMVPSMGNGTANSSFIRGRADPGMHPHRDMFSKLEKTLALLGMTSSEVLSWAPGALSYCDRGIPTLLHTHLLASPSIMSKRIASGNLNSTQRSYVQGSIHSRALVAIEGMRSQRDPLHPSDPRPESPQGALMEMLSTLTNRKTWVEELHTWLQLNPLAVDIVQVAARQVPIITVAQDFQDGKYNFMDCELVFPYPWPLWNLAHYVETSSSTLRSQYSS